MDRRSFFKVLGGVAALAAAPTMLLEASAAVPVGMVELGLIREMWQDDLYRDAMCGRFDVLAHDVQLHVDMRISAEEYKDASRVANCRDVAKTILENEMKHRGIAWADIKPLPIPYGYQAPKWTA